MSFEIPPGLTTMLQNFTIAVLRQKPPDLVKFAHNHFQALYEAETGITVSNNAHGCDQQRTLSFTKSESNTSVYSLPPSPGKSELCKLRFGQLCSSFLSPLYMFVLECRSMNCYK